MYNETRNQTAKTFNSHHPFPNATYNLSSKVTPQCKLQYAMDPQLTHGYSKPCGRQTSPTHARTPITPTVHESLTQNPIIVPFSSQYPGCLGSAVAQLIAVSVVAYAIAMNPKIQSRMSATFQNFVRAIAL